jgi:hypothetical protein
MAERKTREHVSVIVVVHGRPEPLDEIYRDYADALRDAGCTFEFVFVAGRHLRDKTEPLVRLVDAGEPIQVLEAAQNVGETAMLRSAAGFCSSPIIVTLPAYRHIRPEALPDLIQRVEDGAPLVLAVRSARHDPLVNRLQRRVVHKLVHHVAGGEFRDLGSGVRAMRAEVLREVPLYGESSRFLPLLAQREGFATEELVVEQHSLDRKPKVYSPGTYLRRALDLAGVFFLVRFREKPLRFFGLIGSTLSAIGFVLMAVLAVQKLQGQGLADRPLLLVAVLLAVLGLQAIALGLIGEIIVHATSRRHVSYRLSRRAGPR